MDFFSFFFFFLCPFHFISFFLSFFFRVSRLLLLYCLCPMIYACMNFSAANIIDNDVIWISKYALLPVIAWNSELSYLSWYFILSSLYSVPIQNACMYGMYVEVCRSGCQAEPHLPRPVHTYSPTCWLPLYGVLLLHTSIPGRRSNRIFFWSSHRCFTRVWLLHSWGTGGGSGSLHCIIMTRDRLVLLTHSLTGSAIQ